MEKDDLIQAIAALKAGDRQGAQAILTRIVQANPRSEQGWLWLGYCLSDVQKRITCYQKVIEIDPQNKDAQKALTALNSSATPAQSDSKTLRGPILDKAAVQSTGVPKGKSNSNEKVRYWISILVPVGFVFLCVLPIMFLYATGQLRTLAARFLPVPSPSATLTPLPTSLPSPTLTPSSSPSPTRIPSTITPRPSPTSTPNRFRPGDPTATPIDSNITDPNFIAGVSAYEASNWQEVIRLMNAVVESNPDLAPPYRYRGLAYWALKDCYSGLADQEKALELNPGYAAAWADRGLMNECLGNTTQELDDYQKALSLDPSLAFVHHNLGAYYYNLGDFESSLEEYSLSAAIDPNRAEAWGGMSTALLALGRFTECIEPATKAIGIKPDLWLAYTTRANCHNGLSNYEKAIADYQVVLNNNPSDPIAWYNLGRAQQLSGNPQAGISAYTKSLEFEPPNSPPNTNFIISYNTALAYSRRGSAYYQLNKFNQALTDLEKSTSLFAYDPYALCYLSLTYYEFKRYQDALDTAATSHEIAPLCGGQKLVEIQARSYYALGNYEQALLFIDKAIDMREYTLGYYYRGIILQAAGRNDEAIRDLEQFLSFYEPDDNHMPELTDARSRLTKLKP